MTQVWVNNELVGDILVLCQEQTLRGVHVRPSPRHCGFRIPTDRLDALEQHLHFCHEKYHAPREADWTWVERQQLIPGLLELRTERRYTATWHVFELAVESYEKLFDDPRFQPV